MNATATTHQIHAHVPQHLPAYVRTGTLHYGSKTFESQTRAYHFLNSIDWRAPKEHETLQNLLFDQGDPQENGSLTLEQAQLIAKLARRFDREGDTFAANLAELALNSSDVLLDEIRPRTVAESMQADREARRFAQLKGYFHRLSDDYELPF